MNVPIATSPGRSGFGPQLSLSYDSGSGNGPFGFGWHMSLPAISRKTDKGLPQYLDADESDVFLLADVEDLVPVLRADNTRYEDTSTVPGYTIHRYRPRIEGLFARIERWTRRADNDVHWRSITKDNVLNIYGKDLNARIADPADPQNIFSWLICETRDDKGNAIVYEYKAEDGTGVDLGAAHERNRGARGDAKRSANRYLKRILYGNRSPLLDNSGNRPRFLTQTQINNTGWLFEVVFDYGEHDLNTPTPDDSGNWLCRTDPFSSYRGGFEVRIYRLCKRVLMFHHFPSEVGVGQNCLVQSTDLNFRQTPIATFVMSISHSGYKRLPGGGYLKKSFPPLEFDYSPAIIGQEIEILDPDSVENLPYGLDGQVYQWVDLDGEGLSGILSEQGSGWFYKRNESPLTRTPAAKTYSARFAPVEQIASKPADSPLSESNWTFLDLAGDGQVDLVGLNSPWHGFIERTGDGNWSPFQAFHEIPNLAWDDPNLKFIDLTGDGHADILMTEDHVFTWYPSLAEYGYGPGTRVNTPVDEESGPRVLFADTTETIFLADFSGDGLTDIARIRNGEICYWPNLGYGRFGTKITMDHAPWFDTPDQFDPRRIRLADIDGSGLTDVIYLGRNGTQFWFNESGNSWGGANELTGFPAVDSIAAVQAVDLLGDGTTCLVWSSALPPGSQAPMKYLKLMARGKPHMMVGMRNNLGAETQVSYAPSTYFYLKDKQSGKPWITRLAFPVQLVERVEIYDHLSGNYFVTRYAYHHGYFDGVEREFRGFGMVEQFDTEEFATLHAGGQLPAGTNIEESSHIPPVLTKTWFHTGLYQDGARVSNHYAEAEYYREPGLTDPQAGQLLLEDTVLSAGLSVAEEREACRALKGSMLRQEVYTLDSSAEQSHPYLVVEQNFMIRPIQSQSSNRHAVFYTHPREAIRYHYERKPADPRITHTLTLEVDPFGNVLKEAAIGYGRRPGQSTLAGEDLTRQATILITYTENNFASPIDDVALYPNDYRSPRQSETRTYEITGLGLLPGQSRFTFSEVLNASAGAASLRYEQNLTNGVLQKRLIEHLRTLYRRTDLTGPLPPGEQGVMALPFENYKLAFTPGMSTATTSAYGGRVTSSMLASEGGYVPSQGDTNWWVPSGRIFFSPNTIDTAAQELAYARAHFFLPHRYRDPFHSATVNTDVFVRYDPYDLLVEETRDPLGNRVTVGERNMNPALPLVRRGQDYRVLLPRMIMDPNRNLTMVVFDALGLVAATAVMGKPEDAPVPGDRLDATVPADLIQAQIDGFFANPIGAAAAALLGNATTRIVYDLDRFRSSRAANPGDRSKWLPVFAATLRRETHASEPAPPGGLRIQIGFSYSDGFGREIQKKARAEAGPVPERDAAGKIILGSDNLPVMTTGDRSPRWVGSGWTIFNNKGKPVRQYEPFFTDTHRYEFDVRIGVSPVLFYDPVERVVATLHPNHTWEKVVFDAWQQATWDVNDTVLVVDPKADLDVGDFFRRLPNADYLPTWYTIRQGPGVDVREQAAAQKAYTHAGTPTITHADSLGRMFLTVVHNKLKYSNAPAAAPPVEEFHLSRIHMDIEGNEREAIDALGRIVMQYDYDMLGNRIHQSSMEAGERWMLNDVAGKSIHSWDSLGRAFQTEYDRLRRPVRTFVTGADSSRPTTTLLTERLVYGEQHPQSLQRNLRGKLCLHFDQAGVASNESYDFKGNLLQAGRRLARSYDRTVDWGPANAAIPADGQTVVNLAGLETTIGPLLEAPSAPGAAPPGYTSRTRYDALNRPTQTIAPYSNQPNTKVNTIQPSYNEGNLLEQVHAWLNRSAEPAGLLNPATATQVMVNDIDYDAKGQRTGISYGNNTETTYTYDRQTFRLTRITTKRKASDFPGDCPAAPDVNWPGCYLQDLSYVYDPAGNITHLQDSAHQTIFFSNQRVEPSAEYLYDALYQLIEATGREHLGQAGGTPLPHAYNDARRTGIFAPGPGSNFHPNNGSQMGRYCETYHYDLVGNMTEIRHHRSCLDVPSWTRTFQYGETSQLEDGNNGTSLKRSNRLTRTTIGATTETYSVTGNGYDAHGSMLRMPQLQVIQWDYQNQLQLTSRQAINAGDTEGVARHGERTWYIYNAAGQRVRKVTELPSGQVKEERIYLGKFEIYRRRGASPLTRETLHVMDDRQRIALIETRQSGNEPGIPQEFVRFQYDNHLGSALLELDPQAEIISYEEYTPFGSTAYQAVRSQTQTPKRYRYTAKERDEESGLYYHDARYFAPWLARWTSCDPAGLVDGTNLYRYSRNNPVRLVDPSGHDGNDAAGLRLPTPSLLDPRSSEERRLDSFRGTLVPALRLGPPPNIPLPGTAFPSTAIPPNLSVPPAGAGGTGSESAPAPPSSGPEVSGSVIPPRLQVDWGPAHLNADTSSASFRLNISDSTLTTAYAYGGNISITARGPTGGGSVSVNPSSGLTTFRVEGRPAGATLSTSLDTQGNISFGVTTAGVNVATGLNPAQGSFNLSVSFGGQPAPIYAPGSTSTLLPDLGMIGQTGGEALTRLGMATPGMLRGIVSNPENAPTIIQGQSDDIGSVATAARAGIAIADVPRTLPRPDVRFRFNLSYNPPAPTAPIAPATTPASPPPGLSVTGTLQIVY